MILPCHLQKLTISLKCGVWKPHVPQRLNIPPECYHFFNKRIVAIWNKEAGWSQMAKPVPTPNLIDASKFTLVWFPVVGFQLMFWFCCLLCIYFLCYANETVISITCLGCNSFYEKTQRVLLFHITQINSKTLAVKSGLLKAIISLIQASKFEMEELGYTPTFDANNILLTPSQPIKAWIVVSSFSKHHERDFSPFESRQ